VAAKAVCLGFPRVGGGRELKKALESAWSGRASGAELLERARSIRRDNWTALRAAGIDLVPSNDFSLYDHVLDTAVLVGAIPPRYRPIADPLERYFAMARGRQTNDGTDVPALEMTKWFDTNYHYIVPELAPDQTFALDPTKLLAEIDEARALGLETRPVILGPVTFLLLSKLSAGAPADASCLGLLSALLPIYQELLGTLATKGVEWIQLDEPCLVLELGSAERSAYRRAFERLAGVHARPKIALATYFGPLQENLRIATRAAFEALHVDLTAAPDQLDPVLEDLPARTTLSLGLVDGRNVWRTDLDAAHALLRRAVRQLGSERVWVAPSCSLLHVPVDLARERALDPELLSWLAFARQKLDEVRALADAADHDDVQDARFTAAREALRARRGSRRTHSPEVRARVAAVSPEMLRRAEPFERRSQEQRARLALPFLPTTTIGSFPQTRDVRQARAAWRAGRLDDASYRAFLREETRRCVERQERIGLDVLVHGEFERTDMVEYFGEQLEGFACTESGWVQSYGSRCVKPPILYGDVERRGPMTVEWSRYAQSLTNRPVKGMLTGPVTILQWSFVRNDQPRAETCRQIALALRGEVCDLEAAGVPMIQVDEPAIREGLPLRRALWDEYLRWAVDAFRLATSGVRDETQIHTHMCYSEFGDILGSIAAMDADVLSIETSRSKMELLSDFGRFRYPNEIGPGVYDIHSPRVPSTEEMAELLGRAAKVVPAERLWINPDCGLKTRGWSEVESALLHMVEAADLARSRLRGSSS
jgi:5-methyltetrahydropteroyltriglutamate--homocysteine methyltransferase